MFSATKSSGPSGYNLTRSLRFRNSASAYMTRTPSVASNQKTWTWSGWVKRGLIDLNYYSFFSNGGAVDSILFWNDNSLSVTNFNGTSYVLRTTQVFRDPSAWYHLVVAMDTTQATSSNRIKIYVNGVQVTAFAASTYPSQNYDTGYNTTTAQNLGYNTYNYFDGYLAEVNFIDGQALSASYFGATNNTTGVWQPAKYGGTYGTNGYYLPFSLASTSSYGGVFNGSAQNLTTSTNASLALGTSNFTIEYWANITTQGGGITLVTSGNGTTTYDGLFGYQTGSAGLLLYLSSTGSSWDIASGISIGSFGSTGKWNHIAITRSGSNFYTFVNGIPTTTFTSSASIYQSANSFAIGRAQAGSSLTGIVSNLRVVVGTALYTSAFTPSTTPLTAVTNTKLLTLQNSTFIDNSTNALSITNTGSVTSSVQYPFVGSVFNDASGNNNGWTGNNISLTSGVTYDSMIDVPTLTSATAANYAVMNPVFKSNSQPTFSNANLSVSPNTGTYQNTFATIAVTSGKWYAEILVTGAPNSANFVGVSSLSEMNVLVTTSSVVGVTSTGYSLQIVNGDKYTNGSGSAYGSPYSSGDILQIALDLDNGKLWFGKNGTWQVSGDPSAGTNPTFSGITGSNGFALGCTLYSAGVTSFSVNFGQQPWSYTPPTGFVALNTYNLPASSIPNGAAYMAATLYTGTGSAQSISNAVGSASFQPDFVWQKARAEVAGHRLVDSVRGATKVLYSNSTSAEATTSGVVDAFNSGGFTGGGSDVVTSGLAAVAWQWKAGGTAVSNTSGSITSSVSANTTSGFSVVTWTSPASGVPTIGHGLGVAPTFIIVKDRTTAYNWDVGCDSIGWANRLNLNTTNVAYAGYWNSTAPTSSVFTYTAAGANSGDLMVAYCFTPIKGFSAFGSYTGNGSTDGPFVYLGFRPRYVMLKVSSTAGYDWLVYDSSRDTYNVTQNNLRANTNDAESTQTANYLDFLSNGFKIRGSSAGSINPSQTVIYAAFAENPFQNSLAR